MRLIPFVFAVMLPLAAEASPLLPDALLKQVKADPASYLDSVATLIASYGAADGITEDQLGTSIALTRAKARIQAVLPLLGADLDADGAVTREELGAAEGAASAGTRARMEKAFHGADADGDAVVTAVELADFGDAAAMRAVGPAKLAGMTVLMGFDADGDGKVTVSEVRVGLSDMVAEASPPPVRFQTRASVIPMIPVALTGTADLTAGLDLVP